MLEVSNLSILHGNGNGTYVSPFSLSGVACVYKPPTLSFGESQYVTIRLNPYSIKLYIRCDHTY